MRPSHRRILRQVLSIPSVPFEEGGVVEYARAWSASRGVAFERDAGGNVLLRWQRGGSRRPTWIFAAHMDHPGFVVRRRRGRRVWAEFRGSVAVRYGPGERVRLFAPGGEVVATVATRRRIPQSNWWTCRLDLDAPADIPNGTVGLWDLPAVRVRGTRLASRACDDQAGTAAVLCALDEIARCGAAARVIGLLTRAEEAGGMGALAACESGSLPRDALVVVIEASQEQPDARLGDGAVIRVGDRVRTFDDRVTGHLSAVAEALSRRDRAFRCLRRLMPGGMCEATLYCSWGYACGAACLPLGNYHNMARGGRIGAERIDLRDFASLVKLLVATATSGRAVADPDQEVRRRFRALMKQRGGLL